LKEINSKNEKGETFMYLFTLRKEVKDLFLEFAYHIAMADGVYQDEERLTMESYCNEMRIPLDETKIRSSVDEILDSIDKECNDQEKRIILFEAIGMAVCDNDFHPTERRLINCAVKHFGWSNEFADKCEQFLWEYMKLQENINNLVIQE